MVAYLLSQSELQAVSDSMLVVFNDRRSCERILEPETKKLVLKIFNSKQHLIDDYVAIAKSDWDIVKKIYNELWIKDKNKTKLPPLDFQLYKEKEEIGNKEAEVVSLAKEYFPNLVKIKE